MLVIVRSFLKWYQTAPVSGRAEAVTTLAEAYLAGQLGADSAEEAEAALTLVLDDPSPVVRRALAWTIALSEKAPRHLLVALAHDRPEVAGLILARSPQLRDADLIDCVKTGDKLAHLAIAMRTDVSAEVSHALADVAAGEALVALCQNAGAVVPSGSYARMVARHPSHGELRDVLSRREDLPSSVRQSLVSSVSADLLTMVGTTGWMEPGRAARLVTDTTEMATIRLALEAPDLGPFVEHLRTTGQLTPSLLLRGLLCGDSTLFGAALATLTDFSPRRIAGILKGRGAPLLALYNKAGLPAGLYPAFEAGLAAIRDLKIMADSAEPTLSRPIIQSVLAACLVRSESHLQPLLAMLRRFDAEAAREQARVLTAELMREDAQETLNARVMPDIDLDDFVAALQAYPEGEDAIERVEMLGMGEAESANHPVGALDEMVEAEAIDELPSAGAQIEPEAAAIEEAVSRFEQRLRRIVQPALHQATGATGPVFVEPVFFDNEPVADELDQGEAFTAAPEDQGSEGAYHAELDALFAKAFAPAEQDAPAPSQGSLRVIERLADQLDESFFANWDIRRNAA